MKLAKYQLLVVDHHPQKRLEVLPSRLDGELAQPLDTLGGVRGEQVDAEPAGTHQHQPAGVVGVIEREPDRRATAQRIPYQRNTSQTQLVEQSFQGSGGVVVELPVLRAFVGVTVAGLVDRQYVETLRQHRDVAGEVRPARRARTAAVQQHHRLVVADTRLVVVQLQRSVDVNLNEPRGRLKGQLLYSRHGLDHRVAGRQPELVVPEDHIRPLGVVGRVHPAGVRVTPEALHRCVVSQRRGAGGLEQPVDGGDGPSGGSCWPARCGPARGPRPDHSSTGASRSPTRGRVPWD